MNERSIRVLEFYKIKEKLRKYAVTSGGKELVDKLAPYSSAYRRYFCCNGSTVDLPDETILHIKVQGNIFAFYPG